MKKPKAYPIKPEDLIIKPISITPQKQTGIFEIKVEKISTFHCCNDKFQSTYNYDPFLILLSMDKEKNTMLFATPSIWGGMLQGKEFINIGWNLLREN